MIVCLIGDDRLLISIRNSLFSGIPFGKNSKVKRAQLGVISGWVTDREVAPGCARVSLKISLEEYHAERQFERYRVPPIELQ